MLYVEFPLEKREALRPLFQDHRPTFLMDTVLEGHGGAAWADLIEHPLTALLHYADVLIPGGSSDTPAAEYLIRNLPLETAVLPAPGNWHERIKEIHGKNAVTIARQAFSDEFLDVKHLNKLARNLPEGFVLKQIELKEAVQIFNDPGLISEDHVKNFETPERFMDKGVGFCILKDGKIVAGASSYAACRNGIEVQVNTNPAYRSKGLAAAVSAALIAHCLKNNMAAHWDAGNAISVKLAEKLGYRKTDIYEALVIIDE